MKGQKKKIEIWWLKLFYTCPTMNKQVEMEVNEHHFSSSESECELCGSHGNISLTAFKCPACGKFHDSFDISSW
jgi:hypothetical protein